MKKLLIIAALCTAFGFTVHTPSAGKTSGYDFYQIVKQFKASGQFDPGSKFSLDDVLNKDIIIINEKNGTCKNTYIAWCPKDTVSTLFMISKQCDADLSATEYTHWDYSVSDGRIKISIETQTAADGHTLNDEGFVTAETYNDEFTFEAVRNFKPFPTINYPE